MLDKALYREFLLSLIYAWQFYQMESLHSVTSHDGCGVQVNDVRNALLLRLITEA
jgi:hypothetical protein